MKPPKNFDERLDQAQKFIAKGTSDFLTTANETGKSMVQSIQSVDVNDKLGEVQKGTVSVANTV